jgi:virginiamycin B lyase
MRRFAAALGCLVICALLWTASASAEPVGLIEEFDVGGWAYSLVPGPGGDVWFSFDRDPVRSGDEAVGRITPLGKVTLYSAGLDPRSDLGEMVVGSDGNLWFVDHGRRPAIGRITPQGAITEFRTGLDPKSTPGEIAAGPDGNVWFTDPRDSSAVGRITPSGEIAEFRTGLSPKGFPGRIVAGPDGNLWFGDTAAAIGRITPAGVITEFGQSLELGAGAAGGPVIGGDGNVWIVANGPKLGFAQITPLGAVSQFSAGLSSQVSLLGPITAGPDGNVWFTARGGRPAVGRVMPSGEIDEFTDCLHRGPPYTGPNSITAGPDGNVWFTSLTTRSLPNIGTPPAIGRITPSGEITEFRAGMTYASSPDGIVTGPDGALWFTDRERRSIGRLVPPKAAPNTFIVRPAKPAKRNGVTSVPVVVPGPGTLTLQPLGLLSFHNKLSPFRGAPTLTTSAASCGNTSFRLALKGIAKRRLHRYGGVRLKAKVAFTPDGGSAYEEEVTIGIGLRRR